MNDLLTEIDRQPIIALKTKITNQPDLEKKSDHRNLRHCYSMIAYEHIDVINHFNIGNLSKPSGKISQT